MISDSTFSWVAMLVGSGGGTIIAFITFWMALSSRITEAQNMSKASEERTKALEATITSVRIRIDAIQQELSTERIEMGQKVAHLEALSKNTSISLTQVEGRLAHDIGELGKKIDDLNASVIRTLGEFVRQK